MSGCEILVLIPLLVGVIEAALFNVNAVLNTGKNLVGLHPTEDYPIVSNT